MFAILFCFLAQLAFARALSVGFPLEDQLPPVARINAPFSWSFSQDTFVSDSPELSYIASSLPSWLAFDPTTRTFHGTPSAQDEGTPRIKITAQDPDADTASSWVTLCVTPYPPPALKTAVTDQFKPDNPSLSSVFLLSPNSALATDNPSLRVPSNWSFSIGFEWDTFSGPEDVHYDALQADGSPLPPWMYFDTHGITLNGVVPHPNELPTPYTVALSLRASGQQGYTDVSLPFNVIVASHELSLATGSLPTVNVTTDADFDVELNSPFDFEGVLVDGKSINISEIVSLAVDTSSYSNWLSYDATARRLSGRASNSPSDSSASLPVVLTTDFNQSLHTILHLAVVPSFFTQPNLDPILQSPGDDLHFSLGPYLANPTSLADVNLTTAFDPVEAGQYLFFDPGAAVLYGTIPEVVSEYTHITVTFTAYSRITHSTSHASLPISLTPADFKGSQPNGGGHSGPTSAAARKKKLILGLVITFALLGGVLALAVALALCKRCARVKDSALEGDAATKSWTEKERAWYGIGNTANDAEKGHGWTSSQPGSIGSEDSLGEPSHPVAGPSSDRYATLGLGLQRTLTRSATATSLNNGPQSPGQLSKAEFLAGLRSTLRQVSDKYKRKRPVIGRPILVSSSRDPDAPRFSNTPALNPISAFPGADFSGAPSSLNHSPSSSTGSRSIPHRRADFAPPNTPVGPRKPRPLSTDVETLSLESDSSSTRTHATEAVVHRAARATSVKSLSGQSYHRPAGEEGPARLVPFTHATRVPVPGVPSTEDAQAGMFRRGGRRIVSQIAALVPAAAAPDDLSDGMRYVSALGEDKDRDRDRARLSVSVRSPSGSFSSLESSHRGGPRSRSSVGSAPRNEDVLRVLVRVGERFRFRVHLTSAGVAAQRSGTLVARRMDLGGGKRGVLPAFLYADLDAPKGVAAERHRDTVKFWGVPRAGDVGVVSVGMYDGENGSVCVGKAVVEVVLRGG